MTEQDVNTVVALHVAAFPTFFLTFLGPRFLKIFYAALVRDAGNIAFVACEENGTLCGFVAGVTQQANFYGRLARSRKWSLAFASAGAVLRKPSIIPRLFRAMRRPEEARESSTDACLMSIGVSRAGRGRGVGSELVDAFAGEVRRRGIDRFCLTTDKIANEGVNAFYVNAGFSLARTYTTPEGRVMNEYLMRLT